MIPFINFKNKKIAYQSTGKGNTLVLLHGFLESLNIWNDFTKELSKKYRVITIDLPGHGQSDCLADVHSMELMAESVKAVLDFLKVKECVMIGHSMGGYVTLAFVELYPDMVRGFGLFHSHPLADSPEIKQRREATIQAAKQDHIHFVNNFVSNFIPNLFAQEPINRFNSEISQLIQKAQRMSKEAIISAMAGMRDRKERLSVIENAQVPFLSIIGKQDFRIPYENALLQAGKSHYAEITVLDNVGHMGFIEAKQETLLTVQCFLKKVYEKIEFE